MLYLFPNLLFKVHSCQIQHQHSYFSVHIEILQCHIRTSKYVWILDSCAHEKILIFVVEMIE